MLTQMYATSSSMSENGDNTSSTHLTGTTFFVDGSDGVQLLFGTGYPNFINTGAAFGVGTVLVDLKDGYVEKGGALDATLHNIQGVQLGDDPSVIVGSTYNTGFFYGGNADDQYYDDGANVYVQGGTGTSEIIGGDGISVFYSGDGSNVMMGGAENFMQAGSTTNSRDVFYGNGGQDFVYGGAGATALIGGSGTEYLTGGSGYNELDGSNSAGLDVFNGGFGTDVFYGGSGSNLLYESTGTDAFWGSGGTDYVYGGKGKSFVYGGSGTDIITTGAGNQYVQAGSGSTFFNDTAANLHAGRFDQIDSFNGGAGTDLYLPTAVQGATSFVSQNGGTAVLTAVGGGTAEIFASGTDIATVQSHTHFTL